MNPFTDMEDVFSQIREEDGEDTNEKTSNKLDIIKNKLSVEKSLKPKLFVDPKTAEEIIIDPKTNQEIVPEPKQESNKKEEQEIETDPESADEGEKHVQSDDEDDYQVKNSVIESVEVNDVYDKDLVEYVMKKDADDVEDEESTEVTQENTDDYAKTITSILKKRKTEEVDFDHITRKRQKTIRKMSIDYSESPDNIRQSIINYVRNSTQRLTLKEFMQTCVKDSIKSKEPKDVLMEEKQIMNKLKPIMANILYIDKTKNNQSFIRLHKSLL